MTKHVADTAGTSQSDECDVIVDKQGTDRSHVRLPSE